MSTFFRSTKLIFWALPNHYKDPYFWKKARKRPQAKFWKKAKKSVFKHFLENFDRKIAFFGARSPLKFSIDWRLRRLYKKLKSVSQKWISQNSTKGDPFGRQGVESLRGGGTRFLIVFEISQKDKLLKSFVGILIETVFI